MRSVVGQLVRGSWVRRAASLRRVFGIEVERGRVGCPPGTLAPSPRFVAPHIASLQSSFVLPPARDLSTARTIYQGFVPIRDFTVCVHLPRGLPPLVTFRPQVFSPLDGLLRTRLAEPCDRSWPVACATDIERDSAPRPGFSCPRVSPCMQPPFLVGRRCPLAVAGSSLTAARLHEGRARLRGLDLRADS